ncbi:MAG: TorA maturation chaperone TorD [Myxococcota bacterium]|jgi:TorA maturation chaperone TorD
MIGATERAILYRLFARLLTEEPGEPMLALLATPGIVEALEQAEPGFGAWLAEADPTTLRIEFARLFLLPRGAAPYASAWIEGDRQRLAEQLASFTHRAMSALDMQQTGTQGRLSLDHLGLLLAITAEALDAPQNADLGAHIERQLLGPWVARFAAALTRSAESPLYRATGRLIAATVPSEDP